MSDGYFRQPTFVGLGGGQLTGSNGKLYATAVAMRARTKKQPLQAEHL